MSDENSARNLMEQVLETWINPEVERRREAGILPDDFAITRAQVVLSLDADAPEVRFNNETKALAQFRAARAVEAGEVLTEADVDDIEDIMLTDSGARTIGKTREGWSSFRLTKLGRVSLLDDFVGESRTTRDKN